MRFLLDHGVGRAAERALRSAGHDVLSYVDVDPHAPDEAILNCAVAEDRVLITTDLDFGELAVRHGLPHRGILILRADDADSSEKAATVAMIVSSVGEGLARQLTVYQRGRLRIGHRWEGD